MHIIFQLLNSTYYVVIISGFLSLCKYLKKPTGNPCRLLSNVLCRSACHSRRWYFRSSLNSRYCSSASLSCFHHSRLNTWTPCSSQIAINSLKMSKLPEIVDASRVTTTPTSPFLIESSRRISSLLSDSVFHGTLPFPMCSYSDSY